HAAVLGELLRGHDLAAGNAGHVRNDGLDLGDTVVAEELADLTHHTRGLSLAARALTGRLAEGGKQRARKRIRQHLPLRLPLHREREAPRVAYAERLDDPVGRTRLDRELAAEAVDALAVERIDPDAIALAEAAQHAARLERHVVGGAVLNLERLGLVVAVIEVPGDLVQLLVKCP